MDQLDGRQQSHLDVLVDEVQIAPQSPIPPPELDRLADALQAGADLLIWRRKHAAGGEQFLVDLATKMA